jgi:hypothetical protein
MGGQWPEERAPSARHLGDDERKAVVDSDVANQVWT